MTPIPAHDDPRGGLDDNGIRHWFAIVPHDPPHADPYELRYFRALDRADGSRLADSYPIMPLPDDNLTSAWPLRGLEMYLSKGDVAMAQQFAHDVAHHHGLDFPAPYALPALDPQLDYYFGYGVSVGNQPSLEAVKTWMNGGERRFDTLTINEYDSYEDAAVDEYLLDTALATDGVEKAMNIAERWAGDNGYLDPQRDDPRIFLEDDAPDDPFTTQHQADLDAQADYERLRQSLALRDGRDWFEAAFHDSGVDLLTPLDDTVNYALTLQDVDPWTSELLVEKYWREPQGRLGFDRRTLLSLPSDDPTDRAHAAAEHADLLDAYHQHGLEAMMHKAELLAMRSGWLSPDRPDPRLFTQGPPDRFETLGQILVGDPTPDPNLTPTDPAPEPPHWQFHHHPVATPDGVPLGTALFLAEFPPDPDAARPSRMAHFARDDDARAFEQDFRAYLVPGLLDAPDLAHEVAKLEGLSGQWTTLDAPSLADFLRADRPLTRDPADWHLYNPHAERDARIEAEGLYYDPIQGIGTRDEGDDAVHVKPARLDLEL